MNNPYGGDDRSRGGGGGSYAPGYYPHGTVPPPPAPDAASVYSQQLVVAPSVYSVGPVRDDISQLGDRTFESRARSIAGSAALVPKAKYSWASESLGTQSTVMTRRSLATASIPEPEMQKSSTAAVEGRMWASFAWIVTS
ncbi:hypothetical protein ACHAXA_003907 [Cyclostephanos tholiformis]|uniref:Uncharacterized protein n=1 Tax=Cyclostephanos tholiformis TaxID=382380 RepID=A0ABD3REA1_9STRA